MGLSVAECFIYCEKSTCLKYSTQVTLKCDLLICFQQTKNLSSTFDCLGNVTVLMMWSRFTRSSWCFFIVWNLMDLDFWFFFGPYRSVVSCCSLTVFPFCVSVVSVSPEPGSDQWSPSPAGGGPQGEAGDSGEGRCWLSALVTRSDKNDITVKEARRELMVWNEFEFIPVSALKSVRQSRVGDQDRVNDAGLKSFHKAVCLFMLLISIGCLTT